MIRLIDEMDFMDLRQSDDSIEWGKVSVVSL